MRSARAPVVPRVWPLAAVAAVVVLLALLDVIPAWPGLPHLVALAPLDVYTDVRLLLARTPSWQAFTLLAVLILAARTTVLAAMLGGLTRTRLIFAAGYYLAVLLPVGMAATLAHLAFVTLYARLFWISLAALLALMILTAAVPWRHFTRPPGLRAWQRRSHRLPVLCGYLACVLLLGVAGEQWQPASVALVPVSALLTAVTVRLLARQPRRTRRLPAGAAMAAVTGIVVIVALPDAEDPRQRAPSREGSLMLMSGINSSTGDGAAFRLDPSRFGYACDQVFYFSYAGPGEGHPDVSGACPVRSGAPFEATHTHRSLDELAQSLDEQVRDLPRPVTAVAHSHSAWVLWLAASRGMAPGIDRVVVIAPFPEGTHGYLGAGENGPGKVPSDVLRLLAPAATGFGFSFVPDAPAFAQTLGDADGPGRIMRHPLPEHVRSFSVPAASDLPFTPAGSDLPADYNACPVWVSHPYLPESDTVIAEVNRFLDGHHPPPCTPWAGWAATAARPFGPAPE